MAKVTLQPVPDGTAPAPPPDTFDYTTKGGTHFRGGRPQGVLKLRLRAVLTPEQFEDTEIREIARAVLSLRQIDGVQPIIRTPEHFEIILARFGNDDEIDAFMSEWQKFSNPEVYSAVEKAVREGTAKGLIGEKLKAHVQDALAALAETERESVKN